jgi:hypothetical protein
MSDQKPPDNGLVDELRDPLAALPRYFGEAEYDPKSLRPIVGPVITTARRGALGLVRRWLRVTVQRQDRVNRLVTRMLEVLDQRSAPEVDRRLIAVEEELRAKQSAAQVAELELTALAQSLGVSDELERADLEPLVVAFRSAGARTVLAVGSPALGRRLRDGGAAVTFVDADAAVVHLARRLDLDTKQLEPEFHIRSVPDGSLDGIALYGIAERVDPGHLLVLLRQLRRALAPGGTLAIVAMDASAVGDRFWVDPRRKRPAPRALIAKMCETAGFTSADPIDLHEAGAPAFVAVIARRA